MLAQQEHVFPNIFSSMLKSMKPLMLKNAGVPEEKDENEDEGEECSL